MDVEDVQKYPIGNEQQHVGILFDLRPLHQLLNPIFLDYNPADTWQKMAPFVWYELRDSLSSYLGHLGFNKPMDPSLEAEYTPPACEGEFSLRFMKLLMTEGYRSALIPLMTLHLSMLTAA